MPTNKRRAFNYILSLAQKTADWTFRLLKDMLFLSEGQK
jgi:hypothetical protein